MSDQAENRTDAGGNDAPAVPEITVTLSTAQVEAVVHRATTLPALNSILAPALDEPEALTSVLRPLLQDDKCSPSVLWGLIVLAQFPADGTERELTTIAKEIGIGPGTLHRYLYTWTAAGLLERDTVSRRYRRPPLGTAPPPQRS